MTQEMRPSRVLAKLRAGEVVSCIKLNLSDARVAEIASLASFDCIWMDLEHVGNDLSVIERSIWAAKAHDVDTLVRVSRGSYSDYIRPLELDAAGIMVPHIMGVDDARSVVRNTRFHPIGLRPVDGGNADGGYGSIPMQEYLQTANEQRFVVVQIEDPEPLDELHEIASLPGIDMLFFGPGDFSQAIGFPGQFDHPRITEAREAVAKAAIEHGKFAGTVGSPESLDSLIDIGYRFVSVGADVIALSDYFNARAAAFTKRAPSASTSIYS